MKIELLDPIFSSRKKVSDYINEVALYSFIFKDIKNINILKKNKILKITIKKFIFYFLIFKLKLVNLFQFIFHGEIKEYFTNGVNALIANSFSVNEYSELMRFVIKNPCESKKIGLNGRKLCKDNFDYKLKGFSLSKFMELN